MFAIRVYDHCHQQTASIAHSLPNVRSATNYKDQPSLGHLPYPYRPYPCLSYPLIFLILIALILVFLIFVSFILAFWPIVIGNIDVIPAIYIISNIKFYGLVS